MSLVWTGVGRGLVRQVVDESESESEPPQHESSESTAQDGRTAQGGAGGEGLRPGDAQDSGDDGEAGRVEVPDEDEVADVLRLAVGVAGSGDSSGGTAIGEASLAASGLFPYG